MRNSVASAPRSTTPPMSGSGPFQLRCGLSESVSASSSSPALRATDGDGGANKRSMSSSTSLASGSSVTTQFCPTVADTRPETRNPSAPCRVTSKLASSLGKSRTPTSRATAIRTSLSATRSKCRPVSATSSIATGTCQGAGACLSALRSLIFRFAIVYVRSCLRWLLGKSLGAGKDDLAADERAVVLGIEPGHRRARIARQLNGSTIVTRRKDIACQRLLKDPLVRRVEGGKIGGLAAIEGFGEGLHPFRHGKVADPHFPQIGIEIAAKRVEKLLTQKLLAEVTPSLRPAVESVQQQHQMQHNQVEPTLDRVRNPVIGVKCHRTGLRHDDAIEGMDCTGLGIAPKPR